MKLQNLKLKYQLFMLIIIAIITLIFVHFYDLYTFYKLTEKRSEISTSNILNQFEENLASISKDIQKSAELIGYSSYIQEYISSSAIRKYELSNIVSEIITYAKSSNKDIFDVVLIDNEGRESGGQYIDKNSILPYIKSKYSFNGSESKKVIFSGLIANEYGSYFACISPFAYYMGPKQYENAGTAIIICRTNNLQNIIDKMQLTSNSLLFVLDNENTIVSASNKQLNGSHFNDSMISELTPENKKITKKYNGYLSSIQYIDIKDMGWKIVSIIPIHELTSDLRPMFRNVLIIGVFTSILLLMIGLFFIRSITIPVSRIVSFLASIKENRLHKRLQVVEKNEIGLLSISINQMLDEIDNMTKRIFTTQSTLYEAELAKKQAQLSALQAQINPHFLYNTLDCIRNIALSYDCTEISTISTCMAEIFRYSVKGDDVVNIKDELECVKNYLEIISIRYCSKYQIILNIEEYLLNIKMIKFILQPIIENAVYHGLGSRIEGGTLKITGKINTNGNVCFEVYDNGKGICQEDLEKLNTYLNNINSASPKYNEKIGIGILNIDGRIKHFYGSQYGIKITSKVNEGTLVIIEFPQF